MRESDADAESWAAWNRFIAKFPEARKYVKQIKTNPALSGKLDGQIGTDGSLELRPGQTPENFEITIAHEVAHLMGKNEPAAQKIAEAYRLSNTQTLAQMVRAKYPGVYDDLDDVTLETKVKAKYPGIYNDLPTSQAKAPAATPAPAAAPAKREPTLQERKVYAETGKWPASVQPPQMMQSEDLLPAAGGTIGGVIGGVPGAALGGMAGEGMRQVAAQVRGREPVRTPTQTATGLITEGAIQGGVEGFGRGVNLLAGKLAPALKEAAEKKVAQALGATKERFKAIAAKRAPEILQRGLGGSRQAILADATARSKEAGQAIDDVLKAHGDQPIPTASVIDALEEAKAGYQITKQVPLVDAINSGAVNTPGAKVVGRMVELPVVIDPRPIEHLTRLQTTMRALGDEATVEHVVATRRAWDQVVSQAGGYAHRGGGSAFGAPLAEQTEAWAKKQATTAIRKVLADEVPDLAKVNAEFAFWKDLRDVLKATEARTQAQGPGLNRVVTASVGSAAGAMTGEDYGTSIGYAVLGGLAGPKVYQLLTSPKVRLMDARLRNALADALASGSESQIIGAVSRITAQLSIGATREPK